jgi:hypothetical protein
MKSWNKNKASNCSGYVALEFALAMGLLVIPTMMLVLQIPSFLEKRDRLDAIVASIAQKCATEADTIVDGQNIAVDSTKRELTFNSSFKQSNLKSAKCIYESGSVQPNTKVTAYIELEVPSAVLPGIPGLNGITKWTYKAQHSVIIPEYRSFEN